MEYCTFTFKVHYINKKIKSDVAPYRGEHIDEESLREFVIENFSGAAGSYDAIEVEVNKTYADEQEWITDIIDLDSFRYLQKVNGYAGELLLKYFGK
ncbi:hypothetical protein [Taibaiella chishuiensis]|uniref:Uncharacterized protein n=1 Tax=Taibaiella chishuiensis TaxID=1434707 RepID=A0A2P8CVQ4_9BACT|nr:hypothetical protein [Taibaiella chishuiensis]PSK89019.1 hypothetical protein B0I18_11331 [Taibaiella chishuiensis]